MKLGPFITIFTLILYFIHRSSAGVLSPGVDDKGLEWKAEVQRRKQANELIVAQKVNEPIKLAQVPEWKRVLMEKNKQRKQSSNEAEDEHKVSS